MSKVITKRMQDGLDSFVQPIQQPAQMSAPMVADTNVSKPTKTLKRQDGLIERMGDKKIIAEDNRQLLND